MSIPKIKIESDFRDFYDALGSTDTNTSIIYKRYISELPSKGRGLSMLRKSGVKTIDTMAASNIESASKKVVVYTDPSKHDGTGKILMTMDEANLIYPNSLASEFFDEADGFTNRLIQVGSRRFRMIFKGEKESLSVGKLIQFDEIAPSYNILLGLPIYSIDYISTTNGLLAITLDTVVRLEDFGLQEVIKPEDVIREVYSAMIKYNRI